MRDRLRCSRFSTSALLLSLSLRFPLLSSTVGDLVHASGPSVPANIRPGQLGGAQRGFRTFAVLQPYAGPHAADVNCRRFTFTARRQGDLPACQSSFLGGGSAWSSTRTTRVEEGVGDPHAVHPGGCGGDAREMLRVATSNFRIAQTGWADGEAIGDAVWSERPDVSGCHW